MSMRMSRRVLLVAGAGIAASVAAGSVLDQQNWRFSGYLRPEALKEAGFHFPSYMPFDDLVKYQSRLLTHQRLKVEWDSLPGVTGRNATPGNRGRVLRHEVASIPLSPDFTIVERKILPGSVNADLFPVSYRMLVVIGVASSGEIRGLQCINDPRVSWSESIGPDGRWEHSDFIAPLATIELSMPDDPQLKTVVFLRPVYANDGGWSLERLGKIDLPTSKPRPAGRLP